MLVIDCIYTYYSTVIHIFSHSSQNALSITPTSIFSLGSRMRWPTMAGKRHDSKDIRSMAFSPFRGRKVEVSRTRLLLMVAALLVWINLGVLWVNSNNNGTSYLTVRGGRKRGAGIHDTQKQLSNLAAPPVEIFTVERVPPLCGVS